MSHGDSSGASEKIDMLQVRAALALELDGESPIDRPSADQAYAIAASLIGEPFDNARQVLNRLGPHGVVVVGHPFDEMHRLLTAVGIRHRVLSSMDALDRFPRVVFLGCIPAVAHPAEQHIAALLASGAVLVTSDKSAGLPILADALGPGSPQPPHECQLDMNRSMWVSSELSWSTSLGGFLPTVRLPPGFVPIAPNLDHESDGWVLASDASNGAPIVVTRRVGGGRVIHSVSHWWQDDDMPMHAVGRRSVSNIAQLQHRVPAESTVTFGRMCAALGMLTTLVAGLTILGNVGEELRVAGESGRLRVHRKRQESPVFSTLFGASVSHQITGPGSDLRNSSKFLNEP